MATMKLDDGTVMKYTSIGDEKNPLLLFVVGSSGLGAVYRRLALELSSIFRCVYYDKRGFLSRDDNTSIAEEQKNKVVPVEQHADDAAAFIKHLSPDQAAYAFGTSTGGTAVLDIVCRYPELVHTAIIHEPITFSVMRDVQSRSEMMAIFSKTGDMEDALESLAMFSEYMYKRVGATKAPFSHSEEREIGTSTPKRNSDRAKNSVAAYNGRQGQSEAIAMVKYQVDERRARESSDKIILLCGVESFDQPVTRPCRALQTVLGNRKTLWKMPGDHLNFASERNAAEFCKTMLSALREEGRSGWHTETNRSKM